MRFIWFLFALALAAPAAAETILVGDLPRKAERPLESTPGLDTEYNVVRTSDGTRLRTILTRPEDAAGPLPALFVAQWVSCGSMEFPAEGESQLRELARRSGLAMIRVERSGTGDSEGVPCSELDYDTEVRHYREAFDQLARHPWVDPGRIAIYGISLGSTTAPLIAQGKDVAAVIVQGGGATTYLERMINFDRIYLERSGEVKPENIHEEMVKRIAFHQLYLGGMSPAEVATAHPQLADVSATILGLEADSHYGRPLAWHQQAARRDFLEAWTRIEAPVLVVYGEHDQYEMRHGHKLIVDTLNRLRPGSATFLEIPGADHDLVIFPSAEAAYAGEGGETRLDLFIDPVVPWLRAAVSLAE